MPGGTSSLLCRIVPWKVHGVDCPALVVRDDGGPAVNLLVWTGDGCGHVRFDVPREEVEALLYRPPAEVPA